MRGEAKLHESGGEEEDRGEQEKQSRRMGMEVAGRRRERDALCNRNTLG